MFEKFAERLKAKSQNPEITFKNYDEVVEEAAPEVKEELPAPKQTTGIVADSREGGGNIELKVVRPKCFEEVSTVADYLLDGCTVFLNMELLDGASVVRMLDFLNGVTYCTDGDIKNVSRSTYIITPHNVDVSDED